AGACPLRLEEFARSGAGVLDTEAWSRRSRVVELWIRTGPELPRPLLSSTGSPDAPVDLFELPRMGGYERVGRARHDGIRRDAMPDTGRVGGQPRHSRIRGCNDVPPVSPV